jgi:hypothetical protein
MIYGEKYIVSIHTRAGHDSSDVYAPGTKVKIRKKNLERN